MLRGSRKKDRTAFSYGGCPLNRVLGPDPPLRPYQSTLQQDAEPPQAPEGPQHCWVCNTMKRELSKNIKQSMTSIEYVELEKRLSKLSLSSKGSSFHLIPLCYISLQITYKTHTHTHTYWITIHDKGKLYFSGGWWFYTSCYLENVWKKYFVSHFSWS